jgi:hypothetical protein
MFGYSCHTNTRLRTPRIRGFYETIKCRWGQKAGIKEIVKFGPLILVDMDGETF